MNLLADRVLQTGFGRRRPKSFLVGLLRVPGAVWLKSAALAGRPARRMTRSKQIKTLGSRLVCYAFRNKREKFMTTSAAERNTAYQTLSPGEASGLGARLDSGRKL